MGAFFSTLLSFWLGSKDYKVVMVDVTQLLQLGQQRLVAGVLKDWHEDGLGALPFAYKPSLQLVVDAH
ncbi:hypothetical protein HaLaN_26587 [Haematococcus lacustris]|uniref:Uncharacterized protein n=1 Tax=Haematococcus lacustris TaxID=44745 RepID=A0A6A0A6I9_HAELA|nr:hypothetical protein HaLaN_26587 [Haematococcus lacustris]